MDKFSPTKMQEKIINSKSNTIVVSASAGSGKTTVMIERIVNLIENENIDISNILVLTFTNASSADMKEKLYNRLISRAKTSQSCQNAILNLPVSDISTIDSFCQKLVKTFFYLVDVDPAFTIVSDIEEELIKDKVAGELINRELAKKSLQMQELLDLYFERRNLNLIKGLILDILKHINVLADKDTFINNLAAGCYSKDFKTNKAALDFTNNFKKTVNTLKEKTIILLQEFKQAGYIGASNFLDYVYTCLCELKDKADFENVINFIQNFPKEAFTSPSTKGFTPNEKIAAKEFLTPFCNSVKKIFTDVKNEIGSDNLELVKMFLNKSKSLAIYLVNLALELDAKYKAEKKEKALMDFSQIENLAAELLNKQEVQNKLSEKYKYIFADEYQDMNELQDGILDFSNKSKSFYVGDPKQSIYEFRLSNPQIFIDKIKGIKKTSKANSETILLNNNFRSKTKILNFVNKVFEKVMTEKTANIDYKNSGAFELQNLDDIKAFEQPVKIFILNSKENEDNIEAYDNDIKNLEVSESVESSVKLNLAQTETENSSLQKYKSFDEPYSVIDSSLAKNKASLSLKEAMLIYKQIVDLLKQGVELGKISLLVRSKNSNIKDIIKFLKLKDIKVSINFKTNLLEESEVLYLHNYLTLISNRNLDAALVSVMLSPFYGFTENELALIKFKFTKEKFFYECVKKFSLICDCETTSLTEKEYLLSVKIKKLILDLDNFLLDSTTMSISRLAEKIVLDLQYKQKINYITDADVSNINKYLRQLKNFDKYNLTYFLTLTKNGQMIVSDEAAVENDESVKVNTIHSSKGLEYDYVFLIDAGKQVNFKALKEPIIISNKYGIGLKSYDKENDMFVKNIVYSMAATEKKSKLMAEEIRLLYVALTRAKLGLYIFGKIDLEKVKEFQTEEDVLKSKSYLEFILGTLPTIKYEKLLSYQSLIYNEAEYIIASEVKLEQELQNLNKIKILPTAKKEDIEKIKNSLAESETKIKVTNIKLKNSVTGLLADKALEPSLIFTPKEVTEEEKVVNNVNFKKTETAQGLAYHSFLEKFNFESLFNDKSGCQNIIEDTISKMPLNESTLLSIQILEKIVADDNLINLFKQGKVYKEQKFIIKLKANEVLDIRDSEYIYVQGIIDVLIDTKDGFIIIDYKASGANEDYLRETYSAQLKLYKLAAEKILRKDCKKLFVYSLFSGKLLEIK